MTLRNSLTLLLAVPFFLIACDSPPETEIEPATSENDAVAVDLTEDRDAADLFF